VLSKRIIACLDVDEGRVVKGISFRDLRDAGDPVEVACRHGEAGADEIVLLDISATRHGRSTALDVVRRVGRELFIPFTVGGGIGSMPQAAAAIEAGADKVAVNSAALACPRLIEEIAARYGSQAVVVAVDAKRRCTGGGWDVWSAGGSRPTGRDALVWVREAERRGAGEILLTSMDRDGTRSGFDCELTASVADAVRIPVIASGGAGGAEHFGAVLREGKADAALAASVFHYDIESMECLKRFLRSQGIPVRLPS
jgi:imidazole glycerol-phosphate synthase subunit HisF